MFINAAMKRPCALGTETNRSNKSTNSSITANYKKCAIQSRALKLVKRTRKGHVGTKDFHANNRVGARGERENLGFGDQGCKEFLSLNK